MSPARKAARKAKKPSPGDSRLRTAAAGAPLWPGAYERLLEDPAFGPLVERVGPIRFPELGRLETFPFLVRSITFQQLAGKAAATIHGRLVGALGGAVTPASVLRAPEESLRAAGLSRGKLASIRDLAAKVADGAVELEGIERLTDAEVVERLVQVRGIGRWTAEMLLIFHLRRPDVWPVGDLGVRAGLGKLLGRAAPDPRETELIGTGYRPWRSATAWYCWRALEPPQPD